MVQGFDSGLFRSPIAGSVLNAAWSIIETQRGRSAGNAPMKDAHGCLATMTAVDLSGASWGLACEFDATMSTFRLTLAKYS